MGALVVYVHGLWLGGGEAFLLRRRLAAALGAETRAFPYPSMSASISDSAVALRGYLQETKAERLHLVGHSLGGLVILRLFERTLDRAPHALPPGRVVLLGSPVRGSRSAQRLVRLPLGRTLLGRPAADALLMGAAPQWPAGREVGVIAGNRAVGLGRVLGRIDRPNDGTVLVEETQLPGATAHLQLPVTHSGLVFSAAVARQAAAFLRDGRFEPAAP